MHPVLKDAIDNPRFSRPYGSDRGDLAVDGASGMSVDRYIKANLMNNIGLNLVPANDNMIQHSD